MPDPHAMKHSLPKTWSNRPPIVDRTWEWDEVKDEIDADMWAAICGHIHDVEMMHDALYNLLNEMFPQHFPSEDEVDK